MIFRAVPISLVLFALNTAPAYAFSIVHSNDVMGDIEPCGCQGLPKGGMVRKESLLKGLGDPDLLQLDAGDLLFSTESIPDLLGSESELQARYLLKALNLLRHDAVVPGEKDFALGLAAFEKLISETPVQFVAANLVKINDSPFLKPYASFKRKTKGGEIRIAVIGLVGEALRYPSELKIEPVVTTAKKYVTELRNNVDLLIALTHQGHELDRALAQAVPELDLIVGGHSQAFLQVPEVIGKTAIIEAAYRNQYVGVLSPEFEKGQIKKPLTVYQTIALDGFYDAPEKAPATPMQQLVSEFKEAQSKAKKDRDARLMDRPRSNIAEKSEFQGSGKCGECHMKQLAFWKQSPHFRKVNCESCHGAGGNHPFSEEFAGNKVSDQKCLTCHLVRNKSFVVSTARRKQASCPRSVPTGVKK